MFELLLRNAKIVDGTGNPWVKGDVAVNSGRIEAVGRLGECRARLDLDIDGSVLCPGFVDGHSHSDLFVLADPESGNKVLQGCTTVNVGLDGMSVAPILDHHKAGWQKHLSGIAGCSELDWDWNSLGDYFDAVDRARPSVNICSYAGLGTIRLQVMGMDNRAAGPDEIKAMQKLAAEAMRDGARGISAGLIYPPGSYQDLDEMVAIADTVAGYGGIFDVHMRNEADLIDQAMEEVFEIGRRSGIPVLITHFKVRGKNNWGRSPALLEMIDKVRSEGIDVTIAQYPYTAGSTFLHVVIPPWYHAGGVSGLMKALSSERDSIKEDIKTRFDWENFSQSVGWGKIYVSSVATEKNVACEGKSISEIAEMRQVKDPIDAVCDLLLEEELAVGMITFGLDESDVRTIMSHPSVSFITDGLLNGKKLHPRALATYPRILGRYVREQGVLSLEEAVRKMTSLPADKLRLKGKGLIKPGYDADITIFNEHTILDTNSYDDPLINPDGIEHVIVNGTFVVKGGRHTGNRPGRTIRE